MKNELRFSFDYGGYCLWYNGAGIKPDTLSISKELIEEINKLCDEFDTSIDWKEPQNPSPWTKEEWLNFYSRSKVAFESLKKELDSEYELISELDKDMSTHIEK